MNASTPQYRRPGRLNPGDLVGIVAPASAPPDSTAIDRAGETLEKLGFKPRLSRNLRKRRGFLAGTDRDRAGDLMQMFEDAKIRGIFCLRGGYGTARLLDRLDYRRIRANPKVFIGYSDVTSLHCALFLQAGLVTFHGPMVDSDLLKSELPDFTLKSLLRTVAHAAPPLGICQQYGGQTVRVLRRGSASGTLIGGNLSVLCTTIGTPWQPPFEKSILFLEEFGEAPYRIDRLLTHLLNAGQLQKVRGIAVGSMNNCQDPRATTTTEYRQTVEDILKERLLPLGVPLVSGLPFGHQAFNATLPFGARATLDGHRGDLIITEPAVG